ncbi:MAG TPA: carbohydrate ABC transporter permease [Polyangiaceae bacterium]
MIGERRLGNIALGLALLAALAWLFPYAWMLVTSFKTPQELVRAPASLPTSLRLDAYVEVFRALPVARYLALTTVMALSIAALQIAIALPAAYALAKLDFKARGLAFALLMSALLIPAELRFVPTFTLLSSLGLVNTLPALVLPFAVSAFGTFLLRQALLSVPDSLIEAARLDGASELQIVYRLLPPILAPALVAFFLVSFVHHWNDYFWPLVMTVDDSVRTLPLGIALLREQGAGVRWHIVMAGNVLLSVPALVLFGFTQKHLLRGLGSGVG